MNSRIIIVVVLFLALAILAAPAGAEDQPDSTRWRWGIGWDDGIGVRHLISPGWGLGVQFRPSISESRYDNVSGPSPGDGPSLNATVSNTNAKSVQIGAMAYREVALTRWLGVGPYVRVVYGYDWNDQKFQYDTLSTNRQTGSHNSVAGEVGVRPTFTFARRFVLETRLGVNLGYKHSVSWSRSRDGSSSNGSSRRTSSTSFSVFGQNLGPGAVMQFMIWF